MTLDNSEQLKKLFRVQETLANVLVTLVDDLNFKVVTQGEAAATRTSKVVKDLVNKQISGLRDTLETMAQTQLLANIISEGALTKDAASIVPISDRFKASANLLVKSSATLKDNKIKSAIAQLVEFGNGSDSIFALHGRELQADVTAERTVKENAELQNALGKAVAAVVGNSETNMNQSVAGLMEQLRRNRTALLIDAVISMLIAAGIAFFYVRRSVVRRLAAIGESMQNLSSGQLDLSVPAVNDRDEIGRMARSVLVFRDAAVTKERLEREAEEQRRQADEERQRAAERVENERRKAAELEARAAEEERQARERVEAERQKAAEAQAEAAEAQAQVIARLAEGLKALSNGDFTVRLNEGFDGAMVQIKDDFNSMVDHIAETLGKVKWAASEVTAAATEISASTTDLSQSTEQQAASLEETTATMEEISNAVKKNAENAQEADQFATQARGVAGRGGEVVAQAVSAMARIEEFFGQDRRHHRRHRRDRAPDQSARAQRGGGSRPRRRCRPRLCGGRFGSAHARTAFVAGGEGYQGPHHQQPRRGERRRHIGEPDRQIAQRDRQLDQEGRRYRFGYRRRQRRTGKRPRPDQQGACPDG